MYIGVWLRVCLCKGVRSPGTGVTDRCELPCGCWELNLGPLEEQLVFLTPEPSLQPIRYQIQSEACSSVSAFVSLNQPFLPTTPQEGPQGCLHGPGVVVRTGGVSWAAGPRLAFLGWFLEQGGGIKCSADLNIVSVHNKGFEDRHGGNNQNVITTSSKRLVLLLN